MSTNDAQTLAALNAWTTTHDASNQGSTLDNYAPETVTAMRAALDAANAETSSEADALRSGIAGLIVKAQRRVETAEDAYAVTRSPVYETELARAREEVAALQAVYDPTSSVGTDSPASGLVAPDTDAYASARQDEVLDSMDELNRARARADVAEAWNASVQATQPGGTGTGGHSWTTTLTSLLLGRFKWAGEDAYTKDGQRITGLDLVRQDTDPKFMTLVIRVPDGLKISLASTVTITTPEA